MKKVNYIDDFVLFPEEKKLIQNDPRNLNKTASSFGMHGLTTVIIIVGLVALVVYLVTMDDSSQ